MKKLCLFICIISLTPFLGFVQDNKKPLKITFTKIKDLKSVIMIGVYRAQDNFPNGKIPFKGYEVKPEGQDKLTFTINDLAYGEYAIAVYQDENGDKKLNTGMFGIPKEPYAFSNNFRPTFSAPTYKDCKFTYAEEKSEISISLSK